MQSQANLPVVLSSSPCQICSDFWQHSWRQNNRHYIKIVLTSFTAWPQNNISGKPPVSQCEHGNIVKSKFDKTKDACVHHCSSCVFTLNWKQPFNVIELLLCVFRKWQVYYMFCEMALHLDNPDFWFGNFNWPCYSWATNRLTQSHVWRLQYPLQRVFCCSCLLLHQYFVFQKWHFWQMCVWVLWLIW